MRQRTWTLMWMCARRNVRSDADVHLDEEDMFSEAWVASREAGKKGGGPKKTG